MLPAIAGGALDDGQGLGCQKFRGEETVKTIKMIKMVVTIFFLHFLALKFNDEL